MTPGIAHRDVAVLIVDATGTVVEANELAVALFGTSTLVGTAVTTWLPGVGPSTAEAGSGPAAPATGRTAAGVTIPVVASTMPLGDRMIYAIVDLRDPDTIRTAFAPGSSLPSRLIDALDVGIVVQIGGEIISANAAAARTLGLSMDQLLGRTSVDPRWRSVREDGSPFPGETHPAMVALRTGKQAVAIMGVQTPDRDLRWIDVDARPLIGEGDRVVATFTHFIDITAQRRADAERDAALIRYEALLADASDAVMVVDPDGTILYAGPSSGPTLARPGAGLEGTSLLALACADDRPELARALEQCATKPAARTATTIAVDSPGGARRSFEARIRNAVDVPEVGALIVTLTDVHDRVEAAERLRSVNEALEARLAERDEEHRVDRELANAAELLGHCEHDVETEGVVWTAATAVFRGVPITLLRTVDGTGALTVADATDPNGSDLDADECWAMRTHHVHESRPPDGLACRHLPEDADPTICIPLGLATRPYGLLVVAADGAHAANARAFADRLDPFLTRSVATAV